MARFKVKGVTGAWFSGPDDGIVLDPDDAYVYDCDNPEHREIIAYFVRMTRIAFSGAKVTLRQVLDA